MCLTVISCVKIMLLAVDEQLGGKMWSRYMMVVILMRVLPNEISRDFVTMGLFILFIYIIVLLS